MADGDLLGRISAFDGYVHTDSTEQTVCSLTFPATEGVYLVRITYATNSSLAMFFSGMATVNDGSVGISVYDNTFADGGSGCSGGYSTSGLTLNATVTAGAGDISVCLIEAWGMAYNNAGGGA